MSKAGAEGKDLCSSNKPILSHVDKIVLVHQGEIKEQGTYDELLINGPLFKELMEKAGMAENTVSDDADARAEGGTARVCVLAFS